MESISEELLINEIRQRKFYFSKELIFNYFTALSSKPFIILTGISGSGKSKLPQLFSDIISNNDNTKIELIPVKPNWKDSKGLFGYHNLLDNSYYITPLIKLMIRALIDSSNPYFLVLDEMNLAKTEHYFADYLSLIESRQVRNIQNPVDISNLNDLQNNFEFPAGTTLSTAIILAAIDFNSNNYRPVSDYRNNNFPQIWRAQFSNVSDESWTPMFRTELNGDNRLANRVFESPNGEGRTYRLKDKNLMSETDRNTIEQLEELYRRLRFGAIEIYQDMMTLHNDERCLGISSCCAESNCPHSKDEKYRCDKIYDDTTDTYLIPPKIPIPLNLFTIGTVNIDETTYMFSPKVLDRSNVIEFNDIDFENLLELTDDFRNILSENTTFLYDDNFYFNSGTMLPELKVSISSAEHATNFKNLHPGGFKDVLRIFNILKNLNMHFGYRTLNEIGLYITNVNSFTSHGEKLNIAVDLQLLQKILPKFHGTYEKLWNPLFKILITCIINPPTGFSTLNSYSTEDLYRLISSLIGETVSSNFMLTTEQYRAHFKYPRTSKKILNMLKNLEMNGFSSFIE